VVAGIVTPRDAVQAFVEAVRLDAKIADWLRGLQALERALPFRSNERRKPR
jgi:hypothetical protein